MKPHYSEFVRHCLRFYIKTVDEGHGGSPVFKTYADRENWRATHNALQECPDGNRDLIFQLYRTGDTLPDKIYTLSKALQVSQDSLWSLVNQVERKIAKKRGLI